MDVLAVVNFEKFQQYKDRAPKWIKLYNALLDDYKFLQLPDATRFHLIGIWLLASRCDNKIPYDEKYIREGIKARSRVNIEQLITYGFLDVVRTDLYDSVQNCTQRREEKSRGEKRKPLSRSATYTPGFESAWRAYPHVKGRSSKGESFARWKRFDLEPITTNVHSWIRSFRSTPDWEKDGGAYVPGMEVWLKKHRDKFVTEPPQ